jgi:hypothetical protein
VLAMWPKRRITMDAPEHDLISFLVAS